ncbi:hypothetical protein M917_0094 [Psychrobacter aquaticus CMS 56]|uniref:Uncharacterized protein n=1 Tax=Psychrobacter aquaticus CMS 56 TaxID=1354303 RepID=U4T681_9GAMM|nr:hypothetical protein M917_0094 [Psychrobacter aquaticus CMS 56]
MKKSLSNVDSGFFAYFLCKKRNYMNFLAKFIDNAIVKTV